MTEPLYHCDHCGQDKPESAMSRNGANHYVMCRDCKNYRASFTKGGDLPPTMRCRVCNQWVATEWFDRLPNGRPEYKCRPCKRRPVPGEIERREQQEAIDKALKLEHLIFYMDGYEFARMVESWPDGQPPDDIRELAYYYDLMIEESERRSNATGKANQ